MTDLEAMQPLVDGRCRICRTTTENTRRECLRQYIRTLRQRASWLRREDEEFDQAFPEVMDPEWEDPSLLEEAESIMAAQAALEEEAKGAAR